MSEISDEDSYNKLWRQLGSERIIHNEDSDLDYDRAITAERGRAAAFFHAKVYMLADQYMIGGLKVEATKSFLSGADFSCHSPLFLPTLKLMWGLPDDATQHQDIRTELLNVVNREGR